MQQLSYPCPNQCQAVCLRARRSCASSAICRLQMPETPRLASKDVAEIFCLSSRRWTLPVPRAVVLGILFASLWRSGEKKKAFLAQPVKHHHPGFWRCRSGSPSPSRLPIERSMGKYNLQSLRATNSRWPCRRRTRIGGEKKKIGRAAALLAGSSRSFVARVALQN